MAHDDEAGTLRGVARLSIDLARDVRRCFNALHSEIKQLRGLLRCAVTRNSCGTDTWMEGSSCPCPSCQAWLSSAKDGGK